MFQVNGAIETNGGKKIHLAFASKARPSVYLSTPTLNLNCNTHFSTGNEPSLSSFLNFMPGKDLRTKAQAQDKCGLKS